MVMDWQPIETAPKDGTPIIIGREMPPWGFVMGVGYYAEIDDVPGCQGWIPTAAFSDPPGVLGLAHPTHWMPLPKGPDA